MFTDVRNSSTELLMAGKGAESLVEKAFDTTVTDGMAVLPGVISRKKQMVPALINAIKLEDLEETDCTAFVPTMKNRTPRPFSNGRGVLSLSKKALLQGVPPSADGGIK